jgi:hypothetical protein
MQDNRTMQAEKQGASLLTRFAGKVFVDVLPAALTSLIGGVLITQYQIHNAVAPRPVAVQAAPASPEMMQLVHDEHTAIMNYLDTQMAAEKSRNDAEDAAKARAIAAAEVKPEPVELREVAQVLAAAKPGKRIKVADAAPAPIPAPAHEPLAIAQAEPIASAAPAAPPVPQSKSLLEKTLDLKDHVVAATGNAAWTVVSAIGGLPSWIASIGDRKSELTSS